MDYNLTEIQSSLLFFYSKLHNMEKTPLGSVILCAKQFLNTMVEWSGISSVGPELVKQRPFMALFLGAFVATGFLPLVTYLLFVCAVACVGIFLLVVIEGGIITVATVTLLVFLIIPAFIASGLSLFAYTVYIALSQMKILVASAVNSPQNRFNGGLKERCDEKPGFEGNIRFRRARTNSDVSGNDSGSEEFTFEGKKVEPLSRTQQKQPAVLLPPQSVEKTA